MAGGKRSARLKRADHNTRTTREQQGPAWTNRTRCLFGSRAVYQVILLLSFARLACYRTHYLRRSADRVLPSYIQSNRPTAAFAPESQSAATHLPVLEIYVNVLTAALQIRPLTWRLFRLQSYQEMVNNWQKTWALLFFAFFIFLASARLFHRLSSLTTWSNFTLSIPEGHFSLKSSSGKMLLMLMKVFL